MSAVTTAKQKTVFVKAGYVHVIYKKPTAQKKGNYLSKVSEKWTEFSINSLENLFFKIVYMQC